MALNDLTAPAAVRSAVAEFDSVGRATFLQKHGFRPARDYFLVVKGRRYDSKAIAGVAHGYQFPDSGALRPAEFSGGESTVAKKLRELGFHIEGPDAGLGAERARRDAMMDALLEAGGPDSVRPQILRDLGIYGGMQGIWVDQRTTGPLTPDGVGVAVGVLHTGQSYADELTDEGLIYHYPNTRRGEKDRREAEALKNAEAYQLPVFVILHADSGRRRSVKLGWVADHDDSAQQCVIVFGEPPASHLPTVVEEPFRLTANREEKKRTSAQRERSPMFRFEVVKLYGERCALCNISEPRLLEAAHIRPVSEKGSDHPRNGLVLCANHHKAFDAHLIGIEPASMMIMAAEDGPPLTALGVTATSLTHLRNSPHPEALQWRWKRWPTR